MIGLKMYPLPKGKFKASWFFFAFLFIFLLSDSLKACTAFCMKKDGMVLLAKNLDWPIGDGIILINKRGVFKTAYTDQDRKLSWRSQYGSITFNQFGKEFPLGGMNEAGLVVEELNSWGDSPNNKDSYKINEFQWVQYCLDNFSSVEEMIMIKDSIVVEPLFVNLHYLIADKKGQTAIVEFHEGKTQFYYGDSMLYPVLSNNHYENSLKYLSNFKGFGGDLELKNDNTSGERFVRVAAMLEQIKYANNSPGTETAFGMLDSISQRDTQWSIVYNLTEQSIHFKTALTTTEKAVKLHAFDFSCKTPVLYTDVNATNINACGKGFTMFEPGDNTQLLKTLFREYRYHGVGEEPESVFIDLARYGNSIKCER
jgi:choloylglycine hydrolase